MADRTGPRRMLPDPLLIVALALLLAVVVWFLVSIRGSVGPLVASVLPLVVCAVLVAWRLVAPPPAVPAEPPAAEEAPRAEESVPTAAPPRLASVLDGVARASHDLIAICHPDGSVSYASPAATRLIGQPPEAWLGRDLSTAFHPGDQPVARAKFLEARRRPARPVSYEARVARPDGWRWVRVTLTSYEQEPTIAGVVVNLTGLTDARPRGQRGQRAQRGTGEPRPDLADRTLFTEQLALAVTNGGAGRVTLALIDLEGLTALSEGLGPAAVDEVLVCVAERLRRGVRPQDLVARLSDDEFAVLLEQISPEHVDRVADRMLAILAEPLTIGGHELSVPATMGFADARAGDGPNQLIRHAEIARSEATLAGRGLYVRYADDMAPRANARAQLTDELTRALVAEEFELYYQPIVTLPGSLLAGVEALLRWRHPQRGLVPPLDFIPLAEQTGLIVPLGRWVLESACRQAATWLAQYPTTAPATISVNVSPRQLGEPSIVDDVVAALRHSGLPAHRLVVEVTETAVVDHATAGNHLTALHDLGVRIALDDFGTGHSTLSLLDTFPIDQLKLDRSFLREPGHDRIAVAVVKIAQAIGAEVVAEGVEIPSQAERLHALGYGLAQGFHFGRPSTVTSMNEVLRAQVASPVS
jgi:diguanylate cyclase (GGDEF)-like protein/PAS domain S-box-containing protein